MRVSFVRAHTLRTLVPLAAAGLALMSAPAPAATESKPLRMGFICPFTGGSQDFGNSARLGAELAVKEINEAGGYLGRKLEIVLRDDKADPDEGRRVSEDLVLKEKVDFTVGFCNTGVAMKSLDVFQNNKHLLMVPVSAGTAVTSTYPPSASYIFRMSARDTLQASFLVDEAVRRGLKKVAIFADKTAYGEGGFKDVENFLGEHKLSPVYVARFDLGVKSLHQQMQEAKAAGAEVVIGYTVGPEFAVLTQARASAQFTGPLYGSWPLSFRTVYERSNGAAEGTAMVQTIIQDISNERRTSFIARLKRHAGKNYVDSLMAAAQSYDAVQLMMRVLFQTRGDTSGDMLKKALENLERPYPGVITTHDRPFSESDHDAFSRNMIWLGVWRKGEIQFYNPEDAKRASIIRRKE